MAQKQLDIERKLRKSNQLLENVFSSSTFLIAYLDRDFNFIRVNRRYAEASGYPPDYFPGKNHFDLFPDEENLGLFRQVVATGDPFTVWAKPFIYPKDQESRITYWDWSLYPVYDENGLVEAVVLFLVDVTPREEAARALKQNETKLQTIIDSVPPFIFIKDLENRFILVNDSFAKAQGVSKEKLIGTSVFDLYSKDVAEGYRRDDRFVIEEGREKRGVIEQGLRLGGDIGWYSTDKVPYRDIDGKIIGVIGVAVDITPLHQAEDALRRSEARFKSLVESTSDWVWEIDGDDKFTYVSPKVKELLGYEPLEIIGKTPFDLMPEKEVSPLKEFWHKIKSAPKAFSFLENTNLHKDGREVILETSGVPVLDDKGVLTGYRGIDRDITERKKAEAQLKNAEEEWEKTFQAIGDIVIIIDPEHRILRANKSAGEAFGMEPDRMKGRLCHQLFHQNDEPCSECPAVKSLRDMQTHTAEIQCPGLDRIFIFSSSPIFTEEGKLSRLVLFAKDITEQKELEAQLRQSQKMEAVGTLAGGIAHDFNNILTPILGYTEMAMEGLPPGSTAIAELQQVLNASKRAGSLVKQILNFSRQCEHELRPLKVQFVIKEALKMLRSSIPTTIELRQDIDEKCSPVVADPIQIHQIIVNLCTNAYQAMRDKGGKLEVSLSEVNLTGDDLNNKIGLTEGLYAKLRISDTGHGINLAIQGRIFEPYFTTKCQEEGTGLGLSVVHGIVKSLNGDITVYSEPDKGTVFNIYLPVVELKTEKDSETKSAETLQTGSEHVLVVDDEEEIVNLEKRMLEKLGYRVTGMTDSVEIWSILRNQPDSFDLMVTDMTMPGINGYDLSRKYLSIRPDARIILCTGFSELIDEKKAKEAGISEFIMKPVLKKDLARAVRRALDKA